MTDYEQIFRALWAVRKKIIMITTVLTIIVAIATLFMTPKFTSSAILIPGSENNQGAIGELAGLAGISLKASGAQDLTLIYPDIIVSEAILSEVIYNHYRLEDGSQKNIVEIYGYADRDSNRAYELTLELLREKLKITMDKKTWIISLMLEEREPQLSADILNETLLQLDSFLRKKRNTSALEQRIFIENRMKEISRELEKSENDLKKFRDVNKVISMSPALALQQSRFEREVYINNALFLELKKQFEMAKIEEVKNIPIVTILDKARPASQKSSPVRKRIVFISFIVSLICVSAFYYYKNSILSSLQSINAIIKDFEK